ncbi:hypothetical protein [Pseudonocardia sp.]|uniref:hypothetical protein n=1 Tax=Pseudonocardia sp. TaxID=60912 RepID=UPI003D0F3597
MRRRHRPYGRRGGRIHGYGPRRRGRRGTVSGAALVARRLPPVVIVGGGILVLGGVAMAGMMLALFVITVLPGLLFGLAVAAIAQHRRQYRRALHHHHHHRYAAHPAMRAAHPAVRAPHPELAWRAARDRFARVRAEYASYECEPMNVLRLPALADVSVESTARFVDAFAHAQAFESETFPPPQHAAEFVAAVDRAERAWRAACDAAERIRLSGLSASERGAVERTIKLLTTARDSSNDAERLAAYGLARNELAKLEKAGAVHVPRPAQAILDAAARGQLPAA